MKFLSYLTRRLIAGVLALFLVLDPALGQAAAHRGSPPADYAHHQLFQSEALVVSLWKFIHPIFSRPSIRLNQSVAAIAAIGPSREDSWMVAGTLIVAMAASQGLNTAAFKWWLHQRNQDLRAASDWLGQVKGDETWRLKTRSAKLVKWFEVFHQDLQNRVDVFQRRKTKSRSRVSLEAMLAEADAVNISESPAPFVRQKLNAIQAITNELLSPPQKTVPKETTRRRSKEPKMKESPAPPKLLPTVSLPRDHSARTWHIDRFSSTLKKLYEDRLRRQNLTVWEVQDKVQWLLTLSAMQGGVVLSFTVPVVAEILHEHPLKIKETLSVLERQGWLIIRPAQEYGIDGEVVVIRDHAVLARLISTAIDATTPLFIEYGTYYQRLYDHALKGDVHLREMQTDPQFLLDTEKLMSQLLMWGWQREALESFTAKKMIQAIKSEVAPRIEAVKLKRGLEKRIDGLVSEAQKSNVPIESEIDQTLPEDLVYHELRAAVKRHGRVYLEGRANSVPLSINRYSRMIDQMIQWMPPEIYEYVELRLLSSFLKFPDPGLSRELVRLRIAFVEKIVEAHRHTNEFAERGDPLHIESDSQPDGQAPAGDPLRRIPAGVFAGKNIPFASASRAVLAWIILEYLDRPDPDLSVAFDTDSILLGLEKADYSWPALESLRRLGKKQYASQVWTQIGRRGEIFGKGRLSSEGKYVHRWTATEEANSLPELRKDLLDTVRHLQQLFLIQEVAEKIFDCLVEVTIDSDVPIALRSEEIAKTLNENGTYVTPAEVQAQLNRWSDGVKKLGRGYVRRWWDRDSPGTKVPTWVPEGWREKHYARWKPFDGERNHWQGLGSWTLQGSIAAGNRRAEGSDVLYGPQNIPGARRGRSDRHYRHTMVRRYGDANENMRYTLPSNEDLKAGHDLGTWTPGDFLGQKMEQQGLIPETIAKPLGKTPEQIRRYLRNATLTPLDVARHFARIAAFDFQFYLNGILIPYADIHNRRIYKKSFSKGRDKLGPQQIKKKHLPSLSSLTAIHYSDKLYRSFLKIMGIRFYNARMQIGLTQKEMAKPLGVSQTYLAKIENGKAGASLRFILRLAHALDLHPSFVLSLNAHEKLRRNGYKVMRLSTVAQNVRKVMRPSKNFDGQVWERRTGIELRSLYSSLEKLDEGRSIAVKTVLKQFLVGFQTNSASIFSRPKVRRAA